MGKITIIEGARGIGKSTVVNELRYRSTNTVSMNLTGINGDSKEVMQATLSHYNNILNFIRQESKSPINYIFDRMFFSEMVYSKLYKSYDFEEAYEYLLDQLKLIAKNTEIHLIFLTADDKTFEKRLSRKGKAELFGEIQDKKHESLKQDVEYRKLMGVLMSENSDIKFYGMSCTNLTLDEVVSSIQSVIE